MISIVLKDTSPPAKRDELAADPNPNNTIPESMLVPIILRKTKLKQKAGPLHQPNASSIMDLRNNIFHKDLTLEPT